MRFLIDTNCLLENPSMILEHKCVIVSHVLREIEKHIADSERKPALAWQARKARNFLLEHREEVIFDLNDYTVQFNNWDNSYVDNKILQACIEKGYGLLTYDCLLKLKAEALNDMGYIIPVVELDSNQVEYSGYMELQTDEELDAYMRYGGRDISENIFGLHPNQYLIVPTSKNKQGDLLRWTGEKYVAARRNPFETVQFGEFKPKDAYQHCALDSLINNSVTMIKGRAGSGKSKLSLEYGWKLIEDQKKDKMIIFCNPVASRNSAKLGFYPGDRNTKLLDSTVGTMLSAKFGSKQLVEDMISRENSNLMLLPFSDIRGFDTTGMNAIVWIAEAQNLDIDLMKLAIQRCGDDTKLIIDGDYTSQVDMEAYAGANNGMRRVSEVFRGEKFYGEVELPIVYRSKMAAIAERM